MTMIVMTFDHATFAVFLTTQFGALNDWRASRRFDHNWSRAMIFTMSHQRTRMTVTFGRRYANAFFARTKLRLNCDTRIRLASILLAGAFGAWTWRWFGDATFSLVAGIRTTMGFTTFAFQFWTRTSIGAIFPFVFASLRWFGERVFRAGWCSLATRLTIVQQFEIVLIATASGIIELDALTASDVVSPTTMVFVASTVLNLLTTTAAIVSTTMSVHRIEQDESGQGDQANDDDRFMRHFPN